MLAVALGACEVQVELDVEVREDGAGLVVVGVGLDEQALARVPDLAEQLRAADLQASGWLLDPPAPDADGITWVRVSKPFDDAEGATAILDEVTGPDGPLSALELVRSDSFGRSSWALQGEVDLSGGVEAFLDESLAALLDGDASGGQLATIEAELGRAPEEMVTLNITSALPGASAQTVEVDVAGRETTPVRIESAVVRSQSWALLVGGAGLLVLAGLVALVAVLRARRGDVVEVDDDEAAAAALGPPTGPPGALEVVLLSAHGAVFDCTDEVRDQLVPFLWEAGCPAEEAKIRQRYVEATLGKVTSEAFWSGVGLDGDSAAHEEFLLYRHQLQPGVRAFVARMQQRGVRVVVIANDVQSWGERAAVLTDLAGDVEGWITSAELQTRFPASGAFAVVARRLGVQHRRCLVISQDLEWLDTARAVGFATAWYEPDVHMAESKRHPTVRSYDLLDVAPREGVLAGSS